jgi:hypothetical protein
MIVYVYERSKALSRSTHFMKGQKSISIQVVPSEFEGLSQVLGCDEFVSFVRINFPVLIQIDLPKSGQVVGCDFVRVASSPRVSASSVAVATEDIASPVTTAGCGTRIIRTLTEARRWDKVLAGRAAFCIHLRCQLKGHYNDHCQNDS